MFISAADLLVSAVQQYLATLEWMVHGIAEFDANDWWITALLACFGP
jgi:hypothetical protein